MPDLAAKKRRLVFLTVNCSYSHSSLALPLLHGACADLLHWEWLRYDMINEENVMTAVREIAAYQCDLLVTDLYLFNRKTALDVLQRYHALVPQCRIAVGGPECLGDGAAELLRQYPWLDCVFRGEGEEIFRDYLIRLAEDDLPGHRILPQEGNAVFAEWASSPYPVEDPFFVVEKPFAQMETSRGCPMGCYYCTSGGSRTRYRSPDQVREELRRLREKGVNELRLLDRTFNLPQDRAAALLRMFREEFPEMRFHLELHPQFLNGELRRELQMALPGQLHIEIGIQCLDQEVQHLSGRRSDVNAALEGLAFLCTIPAFETHADLLAGLPGQKWRHILADAASLMSIRVAEIQLEVLKALPGTPLREIAPDHGICYSAETPYDVMQSNTMRMEEIQWARDLSRLLDLTYNHKHLHDAVLVMNEECPDFVARLLELFHRAGGNDAVLWDLKKRFLFLYDFCCANHLERGALALAYQWLLAGFPPAQIPDVYSGKIERVPAGAVLYAGSEDCVNARETRYWRFPMMAQTCYFAYNRTYAINRPAAIWKMETPHTDE